MQRQSQIVGEVFARLVLKLTSHMATATNTILVQLKVDTFCTEKHTCRISSTNFIGLTNRNGSNANPKHNLKK